jgi:replication fork protection complex subunit Tof1/Swi1
MARRSARRDVEEEDAESIDLGRRDDETSDEEEEDEGRPGDAKERKKAALMPAIASLCSALGGFEEFLDDSTGAFVKVYSLGYQGVGELTRRLVRMSINY